LKDGKEVNAVMLVGRLFHARANDLYTVSMKATDRMEWRLQIVEQYELETNGH